MSLWKSKRSSADSEMPKQSPIEQRKRSAGCVVRGTEAPTTFHGTEGLTTPVVKALSRPGEKALVVVRKKGHQKQGPRGRARRGRSGKPCTEGGTTTCTIESTKSTRTTAEDSHGEAPTARPAQQRPGARRRPRRRKGPCAARARGARSRGRRPRHCQPATAANARRTTKPRARGGRGRAAAPAGAPELRSSTARRRPPAKRRLRRRSGAKALERAAASGRSERGAPKKSKFLAPPLTLEKWQRKEIRHAGDRWSTTDDTTCDVDECND